MLPSITSDMSAQADLNPSLKCSLNYSITIQHFHKQLLFICPTGLFITHIFIIDDMWVTIREIDNLFCGISNTLTESSYLCFHFSCAAGMVS